MICIIFQIIRKSNPITVLFFFKIILTLKYCLPRSMLSSPRPYLSVTRQIQDVKWSLVLTFFFKKQMSSVEFFSRCSCYVFRQTMGYFFFAKHVNFLAIFSCSASNCKTVLMQPRAYRLPFVFGGISSTIDVILPDIAIVFQILPKPAGCEQLAGGFWAKQKLRNISFLLIEV